MPTDRPSLSIALAASATTTGSDFGISVPMLELTLTNDGATPIDVPSPGLPLLLAVNVHLSAGGKQLVRGAGVGDPPAAKTQALAPGASLTARISPLGDGPRDRPLDPGTWRAKVCVREAKKTVSPSSFLTSFGGRCSNEIDLVVTKP